MRLIAKPGGWFKSGTTVLLVADCEEGGLLLSGMRVSEGEAGRPVGEEYEDEELCAREEVIVVPDA